LLRSRKNFDRKLSSCSDLGKILIGNSDLVKILIGNLDLVVRVENGAIENPTGFVLEND